MSKALLLSLTLLVSSAASADSEIPSPEAPVPQTAAERGYENMVHKYYQEAPFMNDVLFENLWISWEPELKAEAAKMSPSERRKATFDRYGFVEAPFENGGYPMGLIPGPGGAVYANCLMCHGGSVAGKPIVGASGNRFDIQSLVEDTILTSIIFQTQGQPDAQIPPRPLPIGWMTTSAGTSNAFTFAAQGLSMRGPDMEILSAPVSFGNMEGSDLDAPAWWTMARKTHYYTDANTPVGPRPIMSFALGAQGAPPVSTEKFKSWLPDFEDIVAWLRTVKAPKYEETVSGGVIDPILAESGKKVFEQTCKGCHGTYTPGSETYPTRRVALNVIGTDPVRATTGISPEFRAYYANSWFTDFKPETVNMNPNGYVAPPLTGVWASAPYFHNGSVPTLRDVLYPSERPVVWKIKDASGYDQEKLGLVVERLEEVPADVTYGFDQRRYFDSRLPSKGKQGHPFANGLSDEAKKSVLEYLKTI